MAHGYMIESQLTAHDISAYVKAAVAAADIDGGTLVALGAHANGKFTVTKATSGAGLYIAKNPAQHLIKVGTKTVSGEDISADPRDFTNLAGENFNVEMLVPNVDVLKLTAGNIKTGETPAVGKYLEQGADGYVVKDAPTASTTSLKILEIGTQAVPMGGIGHEDMTTYLCMVAQN